MKRYIIPAILLLFTVGCSAANMPAGNENNARELTEENEKTENSVNTTAQPEDFLLPSDSREITKEDLAGFNETELSYAYAEIFARHGKTFDDPSLAKYFASKSWYVPDPHYNEDLILVLEKKNADTISEYMQSLTETTTQPTTQTTTQPTTKAVSSADIAASYAKKLGYPYCIYDVDKDGQSDVVAHPSKCKYLIYMNHGGNFTYAGEVFSDGGPSDYADGKLYKSKYNGFYVTDINTLNIIYKKYEVYNDTVIRNEGDMVFYGYMDTDCYVDNKLVSRDVAKRNVDIIEGNVMYFTY